GLDQGGRGVVVGGPALVADRAEYRRAHGLTDTIPRQRWTRVQHGAVGQLQRFARRTAVDQERCAAGQPLERHGVGAVDGITPGFEARKPRGQAWCAACRRTPFDVHRGDVERRERRCEQLEPDVDDAWWRAEQRHQPATLAIAAARRAAWALESMTITPASRRRSTCAARDCGSASVPQTLATTGSGRCARAARIAGTISPTGSGCTP